MPIPAGPEPEAALAAIARLPDNQRRLLGLIAEGGRDGSPRSYEELARLTRVSVAALKSRLFRARERLRKTLARSGDST